MKELLEKYSLNLEAKDVIRLINYTDDSVFLTGKAGTGKSTLLRNIIEKSRKNYIILAPTGIAALNVDGQTIHSFFQFEQRPYLPLDRDLTILSKKQELLQNLDLVIIDEISMVRSDLMNAIDFSLRKNLKNNIPFGGKQLLIIGDLFQLPPVIDSRKIDEVEILYANYTTPFFFSAKAFENDFRYHTVELEQVYRQNDIEFIKLLNGVRENLITSVQLMKLNERYNPSYSSNKNEFEIILATTNDIVRETNRLELHKLPEKNYRIHAVASGSFAKETNENKLPADRILELKEGAQVMFIKNDPEKRWVNGSLGKIISVNDSLLKVKLNSNKLMYEVEKVTWENYEYIWNKEEERIEKNINGTFIQFPIKLAWAVTIHKSQGQSFDKVVIDLGSGAFTTGQTYVALSRSRSLAGITLKSKVNNKDIKVDERIREFFNAKKNKNMERDRFESIVKGMQDRLDKLEPMNIEMLGKIKQIEQTNKQYQKEINKLNSDIISKDKMINDLTKERNVIKSQIDQFKSKVFNMNLGLWGLGLSCLFLLYRLFIEKK